MELTVIYVSVLVVGMLASGSFALGAALLLRGRALQS